MSATRTKRPSSPAAPAAAEPKTTGRDVRVDRVGYVQDLAKLWATPLRAAVKEKMNAQGLILLEGDYYEGTLTPTTSTTIDPVKFYKLFKAGTITEKDFLSAISVSKQDAKKFLAPRDLEAISDEASGTARFEIDRKAGIDINLAQVISNITNAAITDLAK